MTPMTPSISSDFVNPIGDRYFSGRFLAAMNALLLMVVCITGTVSAQDGSEAAGEGTGATADQEADDLQSCTENSPWCRTFYFGIQFLPDYDDESGEYSGLDEQAFFAHFRFDSMRDIERPDSFGFDIRLHQSGAVTEDTGVSVPSRFDDVSDTVDISGHYFFALSDPGYYDPITDSDKITAHPGPRYGLKFVGGGRTRDEAIENEDTLSTYVALGLGYEYYHAAPVRIAGKNGKPSTFHASVAQGEFDFGVGFYEDWAGQLGILANGGQGPDEISVFFGTRKSVGDLLEFIGMTP